MRCGDHKALRINSTTAIRYQSPYVNIGTGFDSRFSKSEGIMSNRQGAKVAKEERDWEPGTRN